LEKGAEAMLKRMIAPMLLIATALVLLAFQPALASEYYSARTPLSGTSDAALNNINLAIDALNGTVVPFDADFSFNETVGPRTKTRGFQKAANGRGVRVTGGGVAQVASTLYLALLQVPRGVEFGEITTYGNRFTGDYVADGSLAVVTDYSAGIDLRFINRTADTRIEMWVSGNDLFCTLRLDEEDDESDDDDRRTVSARIPWSGDDGTLENIRLAAASVYDTTLSEGDKFSFNDVVGPRTKEYGYGTGVNGRGARVTGGGVAQVASAIWLAIKRDDDFNIIEKTTYGKKYNQDYVDNASDAIVTDYQGDTDFSFRYTGNGTATIYTYVEGDYLRCEIQIE
jgi:vancomycin resistance protein YoaR